MSKESDQGDGNEEADEKRVEWKVDRRTGLLGTECWKGKGDHRGWTFLAGDDDEVIAWADLAGNAGESEDGSKRASFADVTKLQVERSRSLVRRD